MSLPHELFDLNQVFTTPSETCRRLGVNQAQGMRVMRQLRCQSVLVAGRPHFYTVDVEKAVNHIQKYGLPRFDEVDPIAARQKLESSFGLPGASTQEMPELYK